MVKKMTLLYVFESVEETFGKINFIRSQENEEKSFFTAELQKFSLKAPVTLNHLTLRGTIIIRCFYS